MKNGHKETF